MAPSATDSVVIQKFKPTGGAAVGFTALALLGGISVLTAVTEPNQFGVRVVLGLLLVMLVTWAALLRPRADATPEVLRLRNLFSDHYLPLSHVEEVAVRQMLHVYVRGQRYVCVGIGRTTRQLYSQRKSGRMGVLGLEQTGNAGSAGDVADIDVSGDYATFVETRIEDLVRAARRDLREQSPEVRREWAVPEVAALAFLLVALLVALLV